jgi:sugar phosphate permease
VTPLSPSTSRAWATVALLWVCAALNYVDRLILTTMRTSLREALPMTDAQFGLLTTVFLVVYAVCSPFAGFVADRTSRSRVIAWSLLAWSLLTVATAWVTTYEQLLATRALLAIAQAAAMPASVALIVEYHRGSTRSIASGLLLSGAMSGGALAGLGGWFAERHGWTFAYSFFGWIGVAHAALLFWALRDAPAQGPSGATAPASAPNSSGATEPVTFGAALKHLFTNPGYLLVLGYACTLGIVGWSIVGWMPTVMKERFAMAQGEAGLLTTICLNVAALTGMLVGGAWAGRWSRTNRRAPVLVSVVGVAAAAPAVLLLAHTDVLALGLAGLALYGAFRYFSDANAMPVLCLYVDPRYRATSWGLSTFFSSSIGGLGIYAAGWLRDQQVDVQHIFHFGVLNLVLCAGVLAILARRAPLPERS